MPLLTRLVLMYDNIHLMHIFLFQILNMLQMPIV